jgi:arginine exporter protein ArgO
MATVSTRVKESPVQAASMLVGAVFLLVGILGFIPGITQNFGDMKFAGHDSHAELLGIFQVSALHNVVHLLFGVIGLAAARVSGAARTFLVGGGVVYLALWVYGLAVDHASSANFVPFNTADNWLHLGLGIGMVSVGVILGRQSEREMAQA